MLLPAPDRISLPTLTSRGERPGVMAAPCLSFHCSRLPCGAVVAFPIADGCDDAPINLTHPAARLALERNSFVTLERLSL